MKIVVAGIFGIVALASLVSAETFCPDGKWLKNDKTCQDCPAGCNLCNAINDQPNCISCSGDKALDLSEPVGVCVDCANNCAKCTGPKPAQCVEAKVGFGLKTGTKDLIPCPSSCYYCSSEGKCSTCRYGYYLEKENCLECPSNCAQCKKEKEGDTTAKCLKCNVQHAMAADKTCKACDTGCAECSDFTCTRAKPFYFLKEGKPVRCPDNCRACGTDGKCTECVVGYGVKSADGTCERCSTLKTGCSVCKDSKCTACAAISSLGRTYNFITDSCVECPVGCAKCTDANTCTECSKNFVLQTDKSCKYMTVTNCLEIGDTVDKCKSCHPSYRLSTDGTKCDLINCASGQGWNAEGTCVPTTILNCKKSDERDKRCIEPVTGYYNAGKETKPCPKGCHTCTLVGDKVTCTIVAIALKSSGALTVTDGVANYCDNSCGTCSKTGDPTACLSCRPGAVVALAKAEEETPGIARFCIDSTVECPKPIRLGLSTDVCIGATPPASPKKKSAMTLAFAFIGSFLFALFL
eukprot:TRINITY_DN437_c0_g4_i3.p1 TRINITY_DN437_c0_g4~~TRINITY_DN437_c0_g4_i3.p1  ORF type:complete len:522 (+),score=92.77 TRINITY_DN437_c0_g4_i3:129-1694(+)